MGRRTVLAVGLAAFAGTVALTPAPAAQALTIPYTQAPLDVNSTPGRSVGKLESRFSDGYLIKCTASVVEAQNRSTLITAAHCVYRAAHGGLATGALFAPAYAGGSAPHGVFTSRQIAVAYPWTVSGHSHYDLAFIVVNRGKRNKAVQDLAGANPIAFNQPRQQPYRILGYPFAPAPPFNGEAAWACSTQWGGDNQDPDPDEQYGPPIILAGCGFDDGGSGGPWVNPSGFVSSVTSTEVPGSPEVIGGPYLGEDARLLYESVASISTAKCKSGKRKKHAQITNKKKKCKRKGGKKR
jgi:hypothetical protein